MPYERRRIVEKGSAIVEIDNQSNEESETVGIKDDTLNRPDMLSRHSISQRRYLVSLLGDGRGQLPVVLIHRHGLENEPKTG
jgi:hypothetical protein